MKAYIIPIGGTGARVMRAIMHLMASGSFDNIKGLETIKIKGIDGDLTNPAVDILKNTVENYRNMYKEGVFKTQIDISDNELIWTPMDAFGQTLDRTLGAALKPAERELYEYLYTQSERTLNLNGGFYSHTSIGSYFMYSSLVDDKGNYVSEWRNFFSGIQPKDKIIIICSMFGGTGASGVPTIARELRAHKEAGADTSQADITGIFLEPYFETDSKNKVIKTSTFPTKSKMALEYYVNQGFDANIFSKMYILGEYGDKMKVVHAESGNNQRNKANIIELCAATAALDAVLDNDGKARQKIMYRGTDKTDDIFSKSTLNNVNGVPCFENMCNFLAFSVLYTKLFFQMINSDNPKKTKTGLFNRGLYRFLEGYDVLEEVDGRNDAPPAKASAESLYSYCMKYIDWFRETVTESQGYVNYNRAWLDNANAMPYKYTKNWIAIKDLMLYDGKNLGEEDPSDMCDALDNYKSEIEPGFTRMINGWEFKESSVIYNNICGNNNPKQKKSLANLVDDIMSELQ